MERLSDKKGFVLILALVTMLAMTLIGLSSVMNTTVDMQLSRNERDAKVAFQLSEAGIREASARLHLPSTNARYIGEKTTDLNYRDRIWNAPELGGTSLGRDFTSNGSIIGTLGPNQSYSVSIRYLDEDNPEGYCDNNLVGGNDPLNATVPPPSCNKNPKEIVMYGQDFNLNPSVTYIKYGQLPVYRISSTGNVGGTSRTIVAYLGESNLNTDTQYGINTNGCVTVSGAPAMDFTNHDGTPGQVQQGPGCGCAAGVPCIANKPEAISMNTYLGDTLTNIKSYSDEVHTCTNASCTGAGDDIPSSGRISDVVTNWKGADPNEGVLLFIDNIDPSTGLTAKAAEIHGNVNGEGILIVTGDLVISGNVTWEGLIYVMGTLTVSGSVNVHEGGIMANNTVNLNGSVQVHYDREELLEMARQTSTSATMVWKRL